MQPRGEKIEQWLECVAAHTARSDDALERCLCFSFRGQAWDNRAPDFETFHISK